MNEYVKKTIKKPYIVAGFPIYRTGERPRELAYLTDFSSHFDMDMTGV